MERFVEWLNRIFREEEGQDLVEYALLLGFIAVVAAVAVIALGENVRDLFQAVADSVAGIGGAMGG